MRVVETEIPGVKLIKPIRHIDTRGFFSEVFREDALQEYGIRVHFVQDNHSLSAASGVIRGLHFQTPPFAQAKLLRVTSGSILDVAVEFAGVPDIRSACRRRAQRFRMEPDLRPGGIRTRLLQARA